MKGINFPEATKELGKPDNMTDEECYSLPVFSNGKYCVSCWELTEAEIENITKTKKVWLHVLSGHTQPPVMVDAYFPFVSNKVLFDATPEEIKALGLEGILESGDAGDLIKYDMQDNDRVLVRFRNRKTGEFICFHLSAEQINRYLCEAKEEDLQPKSGDEPMIK